MTREFSRKKVDDDLYKILRTMYHFERSIDERFGLDYQEIYLLQSLRRNSPQRLTDIARRLAIPMFTASRLVERLVQKKLVSREKGTVDRRSISVTLLPEGEKIVQAIEEDNFKRIEKNTRLLTDEEVDSLFIMAESMPQILGIPKEVLD